MESTLFWNQIIVSRMEVHWENKIYEIIGKHCIKTSLPVEAIREQFYDELNNDHCADFTLWSCDATCYILLCHAFLNIYILKIF